MGTETKFGFCRFCHAFCGIKVTITDGRVSKVAGDVDNPMYEGFSCVKGRALPEQHNHPERILFPQMRMPDGTYASVPFDMMVDDIAAQVRDLIAAHGPRSIALYTGTFSFHYPTGTEMARGFMRAIGSPMQFNSGSIDQPGKGVARALHGTWSAGPPRFDQADTWILVGANPTISMWGGIPQYNPAKRLREAKARGMKLIVIDPRRTEAAQVADIFLQPKPGEDPTVLSGLLRVILSEHLTDDAFIASDVQGLEALRAGVEPFTPEYVERRAGVPAADLVMAARMFAAGTVGSVTAGTGPNMAPRGTLTEYLIACIQTVCGRWMREGDIVPNPYVLRPARVSKAQADTKTPAFGFGEQLRIRGLGASAGGLPTSALAEEILTPGDGQVRALFSLGGNPLAAWPDQLKTYDALKELDLLVQLDVRWSATAKMSTHVLGCKLGLEAEGTTMPNETIWGYGAATTGYPDPYAQWQPALVDPPEGAEVYEEWQLFYRLAQRLGLQLKFGGVELDMANEPTTSALIEILAKGSRIPLAEVKQHPHGAIFRDDSIRVLPKDPGCTERLDVGHEMMMAELTEVAAEPIIDHAGYRPEDTFGYRLISRRLLDVYNSSGRDIPHLVRKWRYNPAFMHPDDMAAEGFRTGDIIEIDSGHAAILGVVEPAEDVRHGAISMAHSFGDAPKHDSEVRTIGSNTGRLSPVDRDFDPIHGLPIMSAIPVNVRLSDENLTLPVAGA
jgi:anaerobic selenocysteine-containing dehydrogenase